MCNYLLLLNLKYGAEEVAQQLRAPAVLAEDQAWSLSPMPLDAQSPVISALGDPIPSSGLGQYYIHVHTPTQIQI